MVLIYLVETVMKGHSEHMYLYLSCRPVPIWHALTLVSYLVETVVKGHSEHMYLYLSCRPVPLWYDLTLVSLPC